MKYYDETTQTYKEITMKALDGMPIGSIIQFAGSVIPTGWMICDGRTLRVGLGSNQTYTGEYADLYKVIGTTYGYVDYPIPLVGAIDFKIPDLRGKIGVGLDSTQTEFDTLGETGGSKALQEHHHDGFYWDVLGPNNKVGLNDGATTAFKLSWGQGGRDDKFLTGSAGTGNSGNLQPYLVVNYIIKVTNTAPTMASVVNATNNSQIDSYSCNYSNEHYGGFELWTNSNPTNDMGSQQITLSTGDYNYYEVYFKYYKSQPILFYQKSIKGLGTGMYIGDTYANINGGQPKRRRIIYVDDTHLQVDNCTIQNGTTETTSNDFLIPYKIIGYK